MLQEKLNAMKAASAEKVPPEVKDIMAASTEKLANSGILQRTIKVGDKCPEFSLDDASGTRVTLPALRQQGPVLISLYRGVW